MINFFRLVVLFLLDYSGYLCLLNVVTFCLDYENIILALPMMLGKEKNIKKTVTLQRISINAHISHKHDYEI